MDISEKSIHEYIKNNPGFNKVYRAEDTDTNVVVSVQTLLDMTNFFAKIAADEAKEETLKNSSAYWLREKGLV